MTYEWELKKPGTLVMRGFKKRGLFRSRDRVEVTYLDGLSDYDTLQGRTLPLAVGTVDDRVIVECTSVEEAKQQMEEEVERRLSVGLLRRDDV